MLCRCSDPRNEEHGELRFAIFILGCFAMRDLNLEHPCKVNMKHLDEDWLLARMGSLFHLLCSEFLLRLITGLSFAGFRKIGFFYLIRCQ